MYFLFRCKYSKLGDVMNRLGEVRDMDFWLPVANGAPLFEDLLFVRASEEGVRQLTAMCIPGLMPVIDRASERRYVQFSDQKIDMLRIILESGDEHILTDQTKAPTFLKGKLVEVTDGPFAGVVGNLLRYKSQHRVFVEIPGLGIYGTAYVPKFQLREVV